MPPTVASPGTRVEALDGLRGVAVLAVTSYHFAVHLDLAPYPTGGFTGVLVFFVLSGYLITGLVWRGAPTQKAFRDFVSRRVQRLGPAVIGFCLASVVVVPWLGGIDIGAAVTSALLALGQVTGFVYALRDVPSPWAPTWSLTVEWVFYLLWPLVLLSWRRVWGRTARQAARSAGALAAGLIGVGLLLPDRAFYIAPVANLGVMLAGACLALVQAHRDDQPGGSGTPIVGPWAGVLALAALVVLAVGRAYPLGPSFRFGVLPATTLFAVVTVACAGQSGSLVARILSFGWLRALGLRAYSIYLWHVAVLWCVWVRTGGVGGWSTAVVAAVALGVVAEVSFRLLEKPVLGHR